MSWLGRTKPHASPSSEPTDALRALADQYAQNLQHRCFEMVEKTFRQFDRPESAFPHDIAAQILFNLRDAQLEDRQSPACRLLEQKIAALRERDGLDVKPGAFAAVAAFFRETPLERMTSRVHAHAWNLAMRRACREHAAAYGKSADQYPSLPDSLPDAAPAVKPGRSL